MAARSWRIGTLAVLAVLAVLAMLPWAACGEKAELPEARLSVVGSLGGGEARSMQGYARATQVRDFRFPADHGAHPDFRTEWWYFTGNLEDGEGRRFGYQLTFFRTAVAPRAGGGEANEQVDEGEEPASSWRTRQVYMAHFAITDAEGGRFLAAERFARGAAGLAGAEVEPFRVWTGAWSAGIVDGAGAGTVGHIFPLRLRAATDEAEIDLVLDAGDWVAQGDRGLSRKGSDGTAPGDTAPGEGDASYYYSFPRLPTRGTLAVGGESFRVEGDSWLDREWSTSLLAEGQVGWDWFSLQLDDGRSVVAFRIRDADESFDASTGAPLGYAALVPAAPPGETTAAQLALRLLDAQAARLRATGTWTSPDSGITWPSGWRLTLPDAGLDLTIEPILTDQELDLAFRYWEGAVRIQGTAAGTPVTGLGYAELTGYGESRAPAR